MACLTQARTALYCARIGRGPAAPGRFLTKLHRACPACDAAAQSRPIRATKTWTSRSTLVRPRLWAVALARAVLERVRPSAGTSPVRTRTLPKTLHLFPGYQVSQSLILAHRMRLRRGCFGSFPLLFQRLIRLKTGPKYISGLRRARLAMDLLGRSMVYLRNIFRLHSCFSTRFGSAISVLAIRKPC